MNLDPTITALKLLLEDNVEETYDEVVQKYQNIVSRLKSYHLDTMMYDNHGIFEYAPLCGLPPPLEEADISHQAAYVATLRLVDYSTTKFAALAIWEGLQAELKHVDNAPKVKCSVICPSLIKTKMFQGMHNPSEFFAPSLQPRDVAQLIPDAHIILRIEGTSYVLQPLVRLWLS